MTDVKIDIKRFSELFILEDGKSIQLEPWQIENIIDPVFYRLDHNDVRRFNLALVGPKKNGKSTLAALVACYMLLADGEPWPEIYSAAGSRDQAKIIFSQVCKAIQRSPILLNEVDMTANEIKRRDGRGVYKELSADAPLQHGLNAHCVIWDEIWNQPNYDLWEALTHSPARKQPLHFCVTYAGYKPFEGDLLYDLYQRGKAKRDPAMWFYWTNKNLASWVTQGYLKQQRDRLPEHIYKHLHCNEWTTGSGSFLSIEDIRKAIDRNLSQRTIGEPGISYYLALDLGLRRDRTAIALCHKDTDTGHVILDHLSLFEAPKGGEVMVEDVEEHILQLSANFT